MKCSYRFGIDNLCDALHYHDGSTTTLNLIGLGAKTTRVHICNHQGCLSVFLLCCEDDSPIVHATMLMDMSVGAMLRRVIVCGS